MQNDAEKKKKSGVVSKIPPALQPVVVCAALASAIKSTCGSFGRSKKKRIGGEGEKTQDGKQ